MSQEDPNPINNPNSNYSNADPQPERKYSKVSDRLPTPAAHRKNTYTNMTGTDSKTDGGYAGGGDVPPHSAIPEKIHPAIGTDQFPVSAEPAINIQQLVTNNAATWGDALRSYEYQKRRVVHPGHLKCEGLRIQNGVMKTKERVFDPILQKFRDNEKENGQREIESRARVKHLNRAKDIQLLREQPFDVINNTSKLLGLAPEIASKAMKPHKVGKRKFPDSFYDYNILSNLPTSIHHYDKPECRPYPDEKQGNERMVPAFLHKDFNILTNRYLNSHSDKDSRDRELNLLEATAKHRTRNRFNPVTQRFLDPEEEKRIRIFDAAHEVEQVHRSLAQVPPTLKNRASSYYNILNPDEIYDKDILKWQDLAEDERKERYKNRHIAYYNSHLQDVKADHIRQERKLNKVHLARYKESNERGFDIVTNKHYHGRNGKPPYFPYPHEYPDPWTRSTYGTTDIVGRPGYMPVNDATSNFKSLSSTAPARTIKEDLGNTGAGGATGSDNQGYGGGGGVGGPDDSQNMNNDNSNRTSNLTQNNIERFNTASQSYQSLQDTDQNPSKPQRRHRKSVQSVEKRNETAIGPGQPPNPIPGMNHGLTKEAQNIIPTHTEVVNMTNILDPSRGEAYLQRERMIAKEREKMIQMQQQQQFQERENNRNNNYVTNVAGVPGQGFSAASGTAVPGYSHGHHGPGGDNSGRNSNRNNNNTLPSNMMNKNPQHVVRSQHKKVIQEKQIPTVNLSKIKTMTGGPAPPAPAPGGGINSAQACVSQPV